MWLIETVRNAFAMFTALPLPQGNWNEKNTRYILCAFPLTGVLPALVWFAWAQVCLCLEIPLLLRGALFAVLPHIVTGGIHLDGYMDTADALASHADRDRKQEILRDPHCGAFAVIRVCIYFTVYTALCASSDIGGNAFRALCVSFPFSRALSGLMLTRLPVAKESSLAKRFAETDVRKRTGFVLLSGTVCLAVFLLYAGGIFGLAAIAAALCVTLRYAFCAKRTFGATSGDLAGWFLVKAEFWMMAAVVAVQTVK